MFDAEAGPSHVIADDSHNETPYVTPKPLVFGSSSSENDDSLSLEHQAAIEKQKWKADTESIPDLEAQRFHARGNPAQPEEKAEEPIVSTGGTMNPDNKEKSVLDSAKSTEPLLHRILKKNHPLIPVFRRKRSWKSVAEEKGRDSEEAQSNEDNAAERTEIRPKKKMPQKEAEAGVEVHGKSRMEERQWIQEYLERSANHDHPPSLLPDDEVLNNHHHSPILLAMANRIYRTKDYTFMNFERLAILNVLHWQHALIEFDEKYRITKKEDQTLHEKEDGTKIFSLSQTLEKYHESLTILHNATTKYRSPDSIAAREFGPLFARELKEPRYWDSEDALNLFDLSLETGPGTADSLRRVLQRYCPTSMLDKGGKNERELRSKPKSELSPGDVMILNSRKHRDGNQISPAVDRLARVLTGVIGGVLLLAPMTTLSFLSQMESRTWPLVATSLFVLVFTIILALTTRATNQELVAATAAYSAVLVVFVGLSN